MRLNLFTAPRGPSGCASKAWDGSPPAKSGNRPRSSIQPLTPDRRRAHATSGSGQNRKNSHRAYVFRFAPESGPSDLRVRSRRLAKSFQKFLNRSPEANCESVRAILGGDSLLDCPKWTVGLYGKTHPKQRRKTLAISSALSSLCAV